jgi:hypothetical protein
MTTLNIEQWGLFETRFTGPAEGNPFLDVTFSAHFTNGDQTLKVNGFYDGSGTYCIRLMPTALGTWNYTTHSNASALNGLTGSFECTAPSAGNHGPVYVHNTFHFAHADGTAYYPFGTTCYAWTHQGDAMEEQTLATLKEASFNKMRMCVFPKDYPWNKNEPPLYAYERDADGNHDFTRFNPAFFQHFEQHVGDLLKLGIEADIIIFHPYDRWGYARMDADTDFRYLSYLIARLAAYRNVWWSLANEYDFMLEYKPMERWDRFFQILMAEDPYNHLRAIHQGHPEDMYDHNKPGVTHVCIQHPQVRQVVQWRKQYGKPIVDDELEYEGNIFYPWGGISAEEEVHRFWLMVLNGGYAGHGETYMHPDDVLWWSKGGVLHGESWKRIAFLRHLVEAAPGGLSPEIDADSGVFPRPVSQWLWNRYAGGFSGDYHLLYTAEYQPRTLMLWLPPDDSYQFELIDTWEMTITPAVVRKLAAPPSYAYPAPGRPEPTYEVEMPGKIRMALRITKR